MKVKAETFKFDFKNKKVSISMGHLSKYKSIASKTDSL